MKRLGIYLRARPGQGGVYQYSRCILDALNALPPEVAMTVYYADPAWESHALERPRVAWRRVLCPRWWETMLIAVARPALTRGVMRMLDPLARAVRRDGPDLMIYPSPCAESFEIGIPYVISIHDLQHRINPQFPEVSAWGELARREYLFSHGAREAAAVLVDGEVGRADVIRFYDVPAERVHPLPFVAPRYMQADVRSRQEAWSLPDRYIFYPAQCWPHKNHANLLRALASLRDSRDLTIPLVLAGPWQHSTGSLKRMVRALNLSQQVHFVGYVPEDRMPALYAGARALVMPTFFGPTNIPPLEAFAVGCPVATSNVHGIPEQVGDAAVLFDPSDPLDIARAVERLWTDDALCRDLVRRGHTRAQAWTPTHFASRLASILCPLLGHEDH